MSQHKRGVDFTIHFPQFQGFTGSGIRRGPSVSSTRRRAGAAVRGFTRPIAAEFAAFREEVPADFRARSSEISKGFASVKQEFREGFVAPIGKEFEGLAAIPSEVRENIRELRRLAGLPFVKFGEFIQG